MNKLDEFDFRNRVLVATDEKCSMEFDITVYHLPTGLELDVPFKAGIYSLTPLLKPEERQEALSTGFVGDKEILPELSLVVWCLTEDARLGDLTHEEFCNELDYNPDSIKDYAEWETCVKTRNFFLHTIGLDELEILTEYLRELY